MVFLPPGSIYISVISLVLRFAISLARLPNHDLGIRDGLISNHREDGPQLQEVVDRAGDRVRAESHQVGKLARLKGATPVALAVELRASNCVPLHRSRAVDGILGSLDADFQRPPGHHGPH